MKSKIVGTPDRAEVDRILEGAEAPAQSRIKDKTAIVILFIACMICFAGFVWALFEGKLIDKLL